MPQVTDISRPIGAAAYQVGNTSSCTINKVKQGRDRIVLGWETVQVLPRQTERQADR